LWRDGHTWASSTAKLSELLHVDFRDTRPGDADVAAREPTLEQPWWTLAIGDSARKPPVADLGSSDAETALV
jgi:hypothetical protein